MAHVGHPAAAGGLQQGQVPGQVAALIGEGVFDRVANPGLGGQVHDPVGAAVAHKGLDRIAVGDVEPGHGETGARLERRRAAGLQRRIIIGVEDVDADDGLAAIQQAMSDMGSDEAGGAGDDDGHDPTSLAPRASRVQYWRR